MTLPVGVNLEEDGTAMDEEDELLEAEDWLEGFPIVEEYIDWGGVKRRFEVDIISTPGGPLAQAVEIGREDGYEFQALSESNPARSLGELRGKIRRGLATRYLVGHAGDRSFSHDRVVGRISHGGVVVDGEFLTFEELGEMLQVYGGFRFDLRIVDQLGDL